MCQRTVKPEPGVLGLSLKICHHAEEFLEQATKQWHPCVLLGVIWFCVTMFNLSCVLKDQKLIASTISSFQLGFLAITAACTVAVMGW